MDELVCALAADTKVETPEGAMAVRAVAGKGVSVLTREAGGRVRFRTMRDARKVAEDAPLLKITLDNGLSFRVGPEQLLFAKGMIECRAGALQVGDALVPAFHYPEGYRFSDDSDGSPRASEACIRVRSVEPDGRGEIYTLGVNQTGCFFVSAGVLCKAEQGGSADAPR